VDAFTTRQTLGGRRDLSGEGLHQLAAQGVSLLIEQIEKHTPDLDVLAAAIERYFGLSTHINAYVNFGEEGALKPHWDAHHVLVLQIHGEKTWDFFGSSYPFPINGFDGPAQVGTNSGEPLQSKHLRSGDVLFVPRGEIHSASPVGGMSVHLAIGLTPLLGADLLQWLAGTGARREEWLRRGLAQVKAGEDRAHEVQLREALHRLIDEVDINAFIATRGAARDLLHAPNLGVIHGLTNETRLRPATRRHLQPLATGELRAGGRTFTLDGAASAAFSRIQSVEDISLGELAAALDHPVVEAVRHLAVLGLIIVGPAR